MSVLNERNSTAGASNVDTEQTGVSAGGSGLFSGRFMRAALALLVLILGIGVAMRWLGPPEMHGIVLQSPERVPDFRLMTSTGEPMSLSDFRGKHVLIYFGYTFCPDVCPTTLQDLRVAMQTLGDKADDVQVIMVSVDPARDSAEQLAKYLAAFDPRFIGMTGDWAVIERAASQFGVFFEAHQGSAATGYLVDHSSIVTLIDPEGHTREVFAYGTPGEDIAADLAYWMR